MATSLGGALTDLATRDPNRPQERAEAALSSARLGQTQRCPEFSPSEWSASHVVVALGSPPRTKTTSPRPATTMPAQSKERCGHSSAPCRTGLLLSSWLAPLTWCSSTPSGAATHGPMSCPRISMMPCTMRSTSVGPSTRRRGQTVPDRECGRGRPPWAPLRPKPHLPRPRLPRRHQGRPLLRPRRRLPRRHPGMPLLRRMPRPPRRHPGMPLLRRMPRPPRRHRPATHSRRPPRQQGASRRRRQPVRRPEGRVPRRVRNTTLNPSAQWWRRRVDDAGPKCPLPPGRSDIRPEMDARGRRCSPLRGRPGPFALG